MSDDNDLSCCPEGILSNNVESNSWNRASLVYEICNFFLLDARPRGLTRKSTSASTSDSCRSKLLGAAPAENNGCSGSKVPVATTPFVVWFNMSTEGLMGALQRRLVRSIVGIGDWETFDGGILLSLWGVWRECLCK